MSEHEQPDTSGGPSVDRNVLDGWDLAGDPYIRTQDDAPFPVDLAAVIGGAIAGKLLGLTVRKSSRLTAATLGTLVGAAIAIGARRMWRLEP